MDKRKPQSVDTSEEVQTVHDTEDLHTQAMQSGSLAELSDVERQESGYPASRSMLIYLLQEAMRELLNDNGPISRETLVQQIDDVLRREEWNNLRPCPDCGGWGGGCSACETCKGAGVVQVQ